MSEQELKAMVDNGQVVKKSVDSKPFLTLKSYLMYWLFIKNAHNQVNRIEWAFVSSAEIYDSSNNNKSLNHSNSVELKKYWQKMSDFFSQTKSVPSQQFENSS